MAIPGVFYIKVAKIDKDGNDQTTSLQSLSNIIIPYSSGNQSYEITSITEYPTYFLFYLNEAGTIPDFSDRADIEYLFSSSLDLGPYNNRDNTIIFHELYLQNVVNDNLNFYNSTEGKYILNTYPQKNSSVEFSGSLLIDTLNNPGFNTFAKVNLQLQRSDNSFVDLTGIGSSGKSLTIPPSTSQFTGSFHLSMSYGSSDVSDITALPGDKLTVKLTQTPVGVSTQQTCSFSPDTYFLITSSLPSGPTLQTIPEPYFSENFSLAYDCQPTFNNAVNPRRSAFHQDIDYNTGLLNPTNFELLLNGVALNAEVQNSNYTSLRHITPRYLGTKNQTEKINEWTDSDFNEGTYGKTPSVESRKTHIAYASSIGGWNPEKLNTSAIFIKYLINEDGDVIDPKISPNALGTNRGTFESGDKISISGFAGSTSGPEENFRIIQRGGARIEPIMYTQIGWNPAVWTSSIELTDKGAEGGITPSFQGKLIPQNPPQDLNPSPAWNIVEFLKIDYQGDFANFPTNYGTRTLTITNDMISEQVNLNLEVSLRIRNPNSFESSAYVRIVKKQGSTITTVSGPKWVNGDGILPEDSYSGVLLNHTIQYQDLAAGDDYYAEVLTGHYNTITSGHFKVKTDPSPTGTINISNLWVSSSGNTTTDILASASFDSRNIIYTTSSLLINNFDNPKSFFKDIGNSGFNSVNNPWVIKYGDEFRFENKEDRVYVVKGVETTTTGSLSVLAVQLDKPIYSGTDLDKFVIRRYVNDPGQVIMSDYKPAGITPPYLIRPEFMSKKLEDNIDKYIKDLTEKGLI